LNHVGLDVRIHSDKPDHGFKFPGVFEITAMGLVTAHLDTEIPRLLAAAGIQVVDESISMRASSAGRYVAVKLHFHARDRVQYEAAHTALRGHPEVKWTL